MAGQRYRPRGSLLGVAAYLLVPGERGRWAAGHFRRAGFELLRGVGALRVPEERPPTEGATRREHIEMD